MNNIVKFGKKKSWYRDVTLTIIAAIIVGLMLNQSIPERVFDNLASLEIFTKKTHDEIAGDLSGYADVIDGDTLKVNKSRIRLHGIDAPEIGQTCWKKSGQYSCGLQAKTYLQRLIDNNLVTCQTIEQDRYGREVAKCYNYENIEINAEMVLSGNAVAYLYYSYDYAMQQARARYNNAGIWAGHFTEPYQYRKMNK